MSAVKNALKLMKDEEVEYVDIRFTDPKGKLQHVTLVADLVDEDFFEEGFMFDGSSIAGWKSIDQSDMKLIPDASSVYIDPFYAEKTMCVHCNVVEPDTGEAYSRDPRGTAFKAEAYLKSSGVGDVAYFGPEAEFFIFDDVRYSVAPNKVSYQIDAEARRLEHRHRDGRWQPRPPRQLQGRLLPGEPDRRSPDLRGEMLSTMKRMGIKVDKHHHEVATCQHELGMIFGGLVQQADNIQKYKYVIHNVAAAYGKTVTFMPKPMKGDNGFGDACEHVDLEGRQAALRRGQVCRPQPGSALFHRRHPQACQGAERDHQPVHQQLQAPDPRLRGPGSARVLRPQPVGLASVFRGPNRPRPSASKPASPIRRPTPIWPSPPC